MAHSLWVTRAEIFIRRVGEASSVHIPLYIGFKVSQMFMQKKVICLLNHFCKRLKGEELLSLIFQVAGMGL